MPQLKHDKGFFTIENGSSIPQMEPAGYFNSKERDSLSGILRQTHRSNYESAAKLKRKANSPVKIRPYGEATATGISQTAISKNSPESKGHVSMPALA